MSPYFVTTQLIGSNAIKKERNSTNELLIKHICYLKCIPGDYLMKLVERMPRCVQSCHQGKGWLFEEYKIYFDLMNTFLVTT
jgi:hypothetical protein